MRQFSWCLIFILIYGTSWSQQDSMNLEEKFENELDQLINSPNKVHAARFFWHRNGRKPYGYVNTAAEKLTTCLIQSEKNKLFVAEISENTNKLLNKITDPFVLTLLDRAIINYQFVDSLNLSLNEYEAFKSKLRNTIGIEQVRLSTLKHPFYTYDTHEKQFLKFFYIHHGNDLLNIFHRNLDRDYTGSFLAEFGTDYLNPKRAMPIKSYQTLIFGLEVYTGNIRSVNPLVDSTDRPSGAFQYIGWGKYTLSKSSRVRYYSKIKVGQIGGKGGEAFQNTLHENVSYSKISQVWNNQIANGGRLAFSFEHKREWDLRTSKEKIRFQPFADIMVGSFMTKPSVGISFTNRKFSENSHHHVNLRNKQDISSISQHLKVGASWKTSYVIHNSMLSGMGIVNSREKKQKLNDVIAHKLNENTIAFSKYVLENHNINRILHTFNLNFSYTTTYATIIYNYYLFSPETKLNTQFLEDNYAFNLSKRWHKFAEIGLSFNIK
jgi:hypothetical protein